MNTTTPWCSSCKKEPSRMVAKGGFNFHLRWETPPIQSTSPTHQILTNSASRASGFFALLNSPYFMILILMCYAYAISITLHPMTNLENNYILCGECHPTLSTPHLLDGGVSKYILGVLFFVLVFYRVFSWITTIGSKDDAMWRFISMKCQRACRH